MLNQSRNMEQNLVDLRPRSRERLAGERESQERTLYEKAGQKDPNRDLCQVGPELSGDAIQTE